METRCPVCQAPIEFAEVDSGLLPTISRVQCPNCGLVPFHAGASTIAFEQPRETQKVVGHFALLSVLGRGSFGAVWLAQDMTLDRKVALKMSAPGREDMGDLLHEAQAAARLKHPNIVSVYEVGNEEGHHYVASEFIDGLNLRDLLTAGKPTEVRAVELAEQITRALQHAHEHGIVHRDVKPSNILINAQGQPFVADFGLAMRMAKDVSVSAEGQIVGTALYMSPEQASGKARGIDGRSDLYSVGVILFEMLTGHLPYRGNVQAVLHQKVYRDAPSPRTLNPDVPKDLETICLKCLERDPDKRYQSAAELADELHRFRIGMPIKARPVSALEKGWRWCRRYKAVSSLLAGLILSLTGGLIGVSFFGLQSAANARLANQRLYRSEMNLASQYLLKGDFDGLRRILDRFGSNDHLAHLRDFAWYYHNAAIAPYVQVTNQGDPVRDVAVFADGRFLAACDDRTIRVWDVSTGTLMRTLHLESRKFTSIAASPIDDQLASGSTDGMVRIWRPLKSDIATATVKHGPAVALLSYSSDGKQLLSAGQSGAVRIWKTADQSLVAQIPTGKSGAKDARFLPDGTAIAVASSDGRVRVWDVAKESMIRVFEPNPGLESIAVSDDGKKLAVGTQGGEVHVWSVPDGTETDSYETELGTVGDLEFMKGTSLLAIPTVAGRLIFYDAHTRHETHRIRAHLMTYGVLAQSANGELLAIGSGDGSVKAVRVRELVRPSVLWHKASLRGVTFLGDDRRILSASSDGTVAIWDLNTGKQQRLFGESDFPIASLAVQPLGELVAITRPGSSVTLGSWKTNQVVQRIELHEPGAPVLAFSPSGQQLGIGSHDGQISLFDSSDWASPRWEVKPYPSNLTSLVVSPDEKEIAVGYADGTVLFVELRSGELIQRRIALQAVPSTMVYISGGRLLAIGAESGELHLRDLVLGNERWSTRAQVSGINALAIFPDERILVTASRDEGLNLWDIATGDLITTLYGHRRQVFCLAVSPDGKTIASGGLEGDIRLWRSATN